MKRTRKPRAKPAKRWSSITPDHTSTVSAILTMLNAHPSVAFAWAANTGAAKLDGRFVRFGFPGQSDVLGMLKGGRFLAVEVKTGRGRPSKDQTGFIDNIRAGGGLAGICRSVHEAQLLIAMATGLWASPRRWLDPNRFKELETAQAVANARNGA